MPQIAVDFAALNERIKSDKTIAHWEQLRAQVQQQQQEKNEQLRARIVSNKTLIQEKLAAISEQLKEVRKLRAEILRAKRSIKYRSVDLRRIDRHINCRKRTLKAQEIKRTIVLARKKVAQAISYT